MIIITQFIVVFKYKYTHSTYVISTFNHYYYIIDDKQTYYTRVQRFKTDPRKKTEQMTDL